MKLALPAAGAVVLGLALVVGLAVAGSGAASPASAATTGSVCVTSGPIAGLSDIAATNARIVVATASRTGGSTGAVIAVMTGYTESGLRVLGNPAVSGAPGIGQGVGYDHDSIGIFQQRPSWGTAAQRLDPVISTTLFMNRLRSDPGWQTKAPTVVAQDVQDSAYDGRPRAANHYSNVYGGNYAVNLPLAERIAGTVTRQAAQLACGALRGGLPASTAPGSHGLPRNYVVPPTVTPTEATVVLFAIAQLDKPYVFGAAGPSAYDCSGLTMAAWAQVGLQLPHDAAAQAAAGTPATASTLTPGDLVLVPGDDGSLAAPGHVGLYIGDGLVLNAADQQIGIRVQTLANFIHVGGGLSALRHLE